MLSSGSCPEVILTTVTSSLQFFTQAQENLWDKFLSYKATSSIIGWGQPMYHLAGW